jgi:hypothetical protein
MENKKELLKNTKLNVSTITVTIWLGNSTAVPIHTHRININAALVDTLARGGNVVVTTDYEEGEERACACVRFSSSFVCCLFVCFVVVAVTSMPNS